MKNLKFNDYCKEISDSYAEEFSLPTLSEIPKFFKRIQYCSKRLTKIAHGSSRVVFHFSEDFVIKVAKDTKGLAQNEMEAKIAENNLSVTIPYHSSDKEFKWIIFQKAQETDLKEIESKLQIPLSEVNYQMRKMKKSFLESGSCINELKTPIAKDLQILIEKHNIAIGDIVKPSSWGIYNNEAKLIDFGLTSEIYQKFFKK